MEVHHLDIPKSIIEGKAMPALSAAAMPGAVQRRSDGSGGNILRPAVFIVTAVAAGFIGLFAMCVALVVNDELQFEKDMADEQRVLREKRAVGCQKNRGRAAVPPDATA
jgi:hypothetical protein